MGDKDNAFVLCLFDAYQFALHGLSVKIIQSGKGLIHQNHRRVTGYHPGDGYAALHAAR